MKTLALISLLLSLHASAAPLPDAAKIEKLTGLKGKLNEKEGVFKVSFPRKDLEVSAAGVKLTPAMGLTAWAAFTRVGDHVAVMGDMVLSEDQVNDAMSAALENGLEVTALHNHFFGDSPKVMFMHVGGMGDEEKLAAAVGKVMAKLKEPGSPLPKAEIDPAKSSLDPKKIDAVLKTPGDYKDGVYKVVWGRKTFMGGHAMGKEMGVNTWAAFAGADDRAVVDGDFAMTESELQPVLKALRGAGIRVVAIHNHMTEEKPRIIFLHYWGVGATTELARGVQAALNTQIKTSL